MLKLFKLFDHLTVNKSTNVWSLNELFVNWNYFTSLIYVYKSYKSMNKLKFSLTNLQWLIRHKTKPTEANNYNNSQIYTFSNISNIYIVSCN